MKNISLILLLIATVAGLHRLTSTPSARHRNTPGPVAIDLSLLDR